MMGYGAGLGFGFGGWLAILGCVLLVVGAIVLIAWAMGKLTHPAPAAPQGQIQASATPPAASAVAPDAVQILRLRFARGEISADEFAAAKQVLEAGR